MGAAAVNYGSAREAREHFEEFLDAADEGRPAAVTRGSRRVAAVDAECLLSFLTRANPSRVEAVAEGVGWSLFLPDVPVSADGATLDEAVDELVDALRDYAEAWGERLRLTPNHEGNWGLVQIITLASDDDLRAWILAA